MEERTDTFTCLPAEFTRKHSIQTEEKKIQAQLGTID